jgi:hypothetical protein
MHTWGFSLLIENAGKAWIYGLRKNKAGFIAMLEESVPQRLKPFLVGGRYGTAEAVPFVESAAGGR